MDRRWRARVPAVATAGLCVLAVAAGLLLATGAATPAVALASSGHWVVNTAENAVVHVDGGTAQVDARVELPADAGEALFALEGDRQGFVVGRERITVFGRSSLTVDTSFPVEFTEEPVGIETVGGPYLVYRTAGTVVRLGLPPLSLPIGGPVGRPVWTDDGTVWLQRTDDGSFCALRAGADVLDCSAGAAVGEPGGLTVTGADAAFVGTRRDAAQLLVTRGGPVGLGADVAEAGLIADRDTEGRLAVVEPGVNRLVLTDSGGIPAGRAGGAAIPVDLGAGEYSSPVAAAGVIAVLDLASNRLLTFDPSGRLLGTTQLPPGGAARLSRGADGRIYVDDADGASTHVVGPDGGVTSVTTGGRLPETVAVAAPPARRSPVAPPPSRRDVDPQRSVLPGDGIGPSNGPGLGPPDRPPPVQQIPPPPPALSAPTGISAREQGSDVTVAWNAVPGAGPVSYLVRSSTGAEQRATGTMATFAGLPLGVSITFTVRTVLGDRASAESAPSNEVVLTARAGPPSGFDVQITPASGASPFTVTWQRPQLNGGQLLEYRVTGTDRLGEPLAFTATDETISGNLMNCEAPYDLEVRAVTRVPGSDEPLIGETGNVVVDNGLDCALQGTISASPVDPSTATVSIDFSEGGDAFVDGECVLDFNGATLWSEPCAARSGDGRAVTVDGLDPGETYDVQLTITVPGHRTTRSNVVTIEMPADPENCVQPDPLPDGCTEGG